MEQKFYELTNPQKPIWLTEQYFTNTAINSICGYVFIKDIVNLEVLKKAIYEMVKSNDGMRLKINSKNDSALQYVSDFEPFYIPTIELHTNEDIEKKALEIASTPFMQPNEFLFQFSVFRLPNETGGFFVNVHHLIGDSWSLGLLVKEITTIYSELLANTYEEKVPPSYLDYIESEEVYKNSDKYLKDKAYWEEVFKTIPEVASIPTLKSEQNNTISCEGKRETFNLSQKDLSEIKAFCDSNKISVYNFFMAVYSLYISRVSNLEDFVIGTPILNRTNFDQKHTIGMFISIAPLRIVLNNAISFIDFAKKIATDTMSIFRHQKYSYQSILEDIRKRDSSIPSLYNIILSYQITKTVEEGNGVNYSTDWVFNGNSSDELQIHLFDLNGEDSMTVAYDYKSNKFDEQEIANLHNRILVIIHQIITNENISLKEIEIVTPEEKHQILYDFNNTTVNYPHDKTIVDLFEEQAIKTPDNVAIVFEDKKLTYKELNEKANQLVRVLLKNDVQVGDVVAIYLNKSLEVVVSMLAILKAGAAFLPLDIDYPEDRLHYIVDNSLPKVVLSSHSLSCPLKVPTTFVDLTENLYQNQDSNNLNISITPEDLMYVMYTSGSTGNPKGVMVKHKNIIRLAAFPNFINFTENEIMVQTGTIVFDACIFEIFGALLHGFKLHILKKENILDIEFFSNFLEKEKITILFLTTGLFNQLGLQAPSMFKYLKYLLTGGDVISKESMQNILETCPNIKMINCYGPTENGSYSTVYPIKGNEKMIPIGKPITNSTAYVVSNSHLCPIGVFGELWVGGDGISRGYLNNDDLTKEQFVQNPFGEGIVYKTGDLVKWLPDGNIEFLGRIDNQVKVRGFRIELSEIDRKILLDTTIKQSLTIVQNIHNTKTICSYIVSEEKVDLQKLKSNLGKHLPVYMIPTFIMQLKEFPLNINGKMDLKAFPIPNIEDSNKNVVPARNELDTTLLNALNKVLDISNISIEDSFFDLGGDSLSAIAFANALSNTLELALTVNDIFKYPVICELSDYISTLSHKKVKTTIAKVEKSKYYPTSSAQKRIYYASSVVKDSVLYNVVGSIIVDRTLDISLLEQCFQTLITRHEVLRTRFDIIDDEIVQVVEDSVPFTLSSETNMLDNINIIYDNFVKPFDLSVAPLFRAKAISLKGDKMLLLLDMHHIISDGTSLSILLQELCDLYNGKTLPEKQIDYKDFSLWEKNQFGTSEFESAKNFWLNQYKDEIPLLNMPTTYARPSVQSFEGSNYYAKLPKEVLNKINEVSKKLGITPYMLLLSVFYILLNKYTSQDDIVIGTPIVGRELPELTDMVGMFVNTLALRNKIDSSSRFCDFVTKSKEYYLTAFQNQIYPFDELVKELKIKKNTSRSALVEVMFAYQNNGYPTISFENAKAEYFIPDGNISKFDLTLEVLPVDNELSLRFEYCTKLFDESFIKRLSVHYCNILNIVSENYTINLSNIDMLSSSEKEQIIYQFNDTAMDFSYDKTLIQLFEEQVQNHKNCTAIRFENKSITYEDLNKKANQIANYLISKNVKRNQIIGVLLTRTPDLLYTILGILKAGAGYMLIDSSLPYDRILFMLQNANCPYLITNSSLKSIDFNSCLFLDNLHFENYSTQNINCFSDNEDSFCVIYTSGSTGLPKGVELKRKGIIHILKNYQHYLGTNDCKNFLSMSSIAFDMFVVENFIPLLSGGTVILTNEEEQKIPTFTNDLIEKEHINFILTTPSRMDLLLSNIQNKDSWASVKVIQLGGEVFPDNLLDKMQFFAPNAHIFNGYGPTEITACCSSKEVTDKNDISIGTPFGNMQIFICDSNLNLCPIGIEGELCIGGYGLAKGYINNPELTQKSFVPNPFGDGLLYKTGDIAKYRENGEIDYIGRRDFQIKIRGLRVELSEIEKQFLKIPNIKNVAVIYKKEHNPYLVAYFTASTLLDITDIRKALSDCLPLYMVPKYIIQLDTLPITLNGKINKKQLENYAIDTSLDNYVAPSTELEKLFCSTWEHLLDTKVGIDNDIFEIGADSLLAIKFKTELLAHNINIAYADIFKYKTVRSLASMHENLEAENLVNYDFSICNKVLEKNVATSFANTLSSIIKNNKNNVLLLGANGFVGMHILQQLIKQDTGNIYCIIRNKNEQDAKTRFLNTLHFYFDNSLDEYLNKRIFMINGNILHKNFGLKDNDFSTLINSIDVVINTAAIVKHYGNEDDFKTMNIDLTQNLIDLCCTYHKRLFHISSLSVSGNLSLDGDFSDRETSNIENMNFAEHNLYIGQNLDNAYIRSKFIAEKLVLEAISQKQLQAKVLRLGNITNRYSDGKFQINCNENAFFNRLNTFTKLKVIPNNLLDMYIEFTPVDSCSQAIVTILQNEVKCFSVYHLYDYHHVYLEQLLKVLEKQQLPIKTVSKEDFKKHVEQLLKSEDSSSTLSGIINDLGPEKQLDYQSNIHILSDFTKAFLYHVGFEWPNIDEDYLIKYIEYMKKLI